MQYTIYELLFFLFLYSFIGWCLEVAFMAIATGKFCNRGVFNAPLCLGYGITMDVLLMFFRELKGNLVEQYAAQFIFCVVITSVVTYLSGVLTERFTGKKLWRYSELSVFAGNWQGILYALGMGAAAMAAMLLIHPVLFFLYKLIPLVVIKIIIAAGMVLLLCDFASIFYVSRKLKIGSKMMNFMEEMQKRKKTLGKFLCLHIWKRLKKAYPELTAGNQRIGENEEKLVFAQGICMDKMVWIFLIGALVGDIIETFFVRFTSGLWMSRSSVIYGPFSIVWGIGAVVLTIVLYRLSEKKGRYIFIGGFFLGGTYEYMCSVFTEKVFGTVFWDYSDMPLNIGGRTNILFCIFWGIAALVWMKFCYPKISGWIEKIPAIIGKIVTWFAILFFICDILISGLAMLRYVERTENRPASNGVEVFLDEQYQDELVEFIWPNMRLTE